MTKRCLGCGALLQSNDPNLKGYVKEESLDKSSICQRCFRIKNYGDYKKVANENENYKMIFHKFKKEATLVLYLCDILNLDESLENLKDFNGKVILVITKKDLLPKSVKEQKLLDYIKRNYKLNNTDIIFVSSNKNYHLDELLNMIYKNKKDNNVYLVGNTNAGKSTLVNALIKSYSNNDSYITTSILPSTTLDVIKIKLNNDITLIDTPGLVNDGNFLTNETADNIKKISCKTEIKPKTYQIKSNQSLLIGDFARIDYLSVEKNSFTLYLSNDIKVTRINLDTNNKLKNLKEHKFNLTENKDIDISGLCFCKIVKKASVNVYVKENIKVLIRNNLI